MPESDSPARRQPELKDSARLSRLLQFLFDLARSSFARLLRVNDKDKPKIYSQVFENAEFADLNYWLEVIFSIGIATLGLIINSPAVVIGAMLISPLMGPIIASGLAIALGDFYLGFKAITNVLLSILASVLFAALITWILPFHSPTPEILSRVQPTILDLGVAILSGLAGAIVVCRGGMGGGITALPGVAVAVALMPPLGVIGFGVGIGWDWAIIRGGGLLFLTNLVAIILSSFLVFFSVRMDAPAVREEITAWQEEHEKSSRFYEFVDRTPLRRLFGKVGTLPRRLLILVTFLIMVSFPLQRSLTRLTGEARVRRAVLDDLREFIPQESVFQEDVEVLPQSVRVRIVAVLPKDFTSDREHELEDKIRSGTGRKAELVFYNVATREELSALSGRLASRPEAVLQPLDVVRAQLLARVAPALLSTWPGDQAPLLGYDVSMGPGRSAILLQVSFLGDQDLGPLGEQALRKTLGERLDAASLDVSFARVAATWPLHFRPGSSVLLPADKKTIAQLAMGLIKFPQTSCAIEIAAPAGKYQEALANHRAEAIENEILKNPQIAKKRLQVKRSSQPKESAVLRILAQAQP